MLNRSLHGKLALRHMLCKVRDMVTQCDVTRLQNEKRGGITGEVFQEQCFLWERGASVEADL